MFFSVIAINLILNIKNVIIILNKFTIGCFSAFFGNCFHIFKNFDPFKLFNLIGILDLQALLVNTAPQIR